MDNKDLFAAMNAEAEKLKAKQPKKEKLIIKPCPPTPQPWDSLPENLKIEFYEIVKADSEAEARKEKGRPKSGYEIKQDAWRCFMARFKKITDENINAAFEVFTKDEIVSKLLADELWFKLSDRAVSLDLLEEELSKNNEVMLEVIREGSTVSAELEKLAYDEVDDIINDYEIGA